MKKRIKKIRKIKVNPLDYKENKKKSLNKKGKNADVLNKLRQSKFRVEMNLHCGLIKLGKTVDSLKKARETVEYNLNKLGYKAKMTEKLRLGKIYLIVRIYSTTENGKKRYIKSSKNSILVYSTATIIP